MDGVFEAPPIAERLDKLDDAAHRIERRDLQHIGVVEIEHALVGILGKQRIEHGAGLGAIFRENVALPDAFGAFPTGKRLSVERDMADQVERIQVLAQLFRDRVEGQALGFQFFDDGPLAVG